MLPNFCLIVNQLYAFIYETKHSKSGLGLPSIVALGNYTAVMIIDKSWTSIPNRNSEGFLRGLYKFLEHCKALLDPISKEIACLCNTCGNSVSGSIEALLRHISENGFDTTYTIWNKHGEPLPPPPSPPAPLVHNTPQPPSPEYNNMAAFLNDIRWEHKATQPTQTTGPQTTKPARITTSPRFNNQFEELFARATGQLYPGFPMTSFDFMSKLSHIKNKDLDYCSTCNASRWKYPKTNRAKGKKVANKIVCYFSLIPRLQLMYSFPDIAKLMTWHATGKSKENDTRNVRLGLAADVFNPFGNLSQTYSMWPVIMTTYNTPPWMCMKETSLMLTMLIPGPKSPAKDIERHFYGLSMISLLEIVCLGRLGKATLHDPHVIWTLQAFVQRGKSLMLVIEGSYARSDGKNEDRSIPKSLTNVEIIEQLSRLPRRVPGKHPSIKHKRPDRKNVLESLLGTLLMNNKSKDILKARQDLEDMEIRP
ncbi:CACTA transposable element [Tanacetum coccineum]